MLRFSDITHAYGSALVLEQINLHVRPGRVLSITGPSGCGKTTLLHIAAGLLTPSSGVVTNQFRRTALMFQEPRLLPWRTTRDNIALGLHAYGVGRAERRRRAEALATRLGLAQATMKYPHQLSGGMRQRAALGRALVVEPDLLLLDEPFSALDIGLRQELHDLLLDLIAERNLAAVFVSHDLPEAVRIGDDLVVLSPATGRIAHHWRQTRPPADRDGAYVYETVATLLREPTVIEAFGMRTARSSFAHYPDREVQYEL